MCLGVLGFLCISGPARSASVLRRAKCSTRKRAALVAKAWKTVENPHETLCPMYQRGLICIALKHRNRQILPGDPRRLKKQLCTLALPRCAVAPLESALEAEENVCRPWRWTSVCHAFSSVQCCPRPSMCEMPRVFSVFVLWFPMFKSV